MAETRDLAPAEKTNARRATEGARAGAAPTREADSPGALQRAVVDAAGRRPDAVMAALRRSDPHARARLLTGLQQTRGNGYVQRLVQGNEALQSGATGRPDGASTTPHTTLPTVQRQGGAPGVKHTFKTKDLKVPVNKGAGPVKLKEFVANGEVSFEQAGAKGPGGTEVKAGAVGGPGGLAGYQAEVEKKWETETKGLLEGFTPGLKAGGEVTTKGGSLGIEGSLEGKNVTWVLAFKILEVDTHEGSVDFATLEGGAELPLSPKDWTVKGTNVKVDIKLKVVAKFEPDWLKIGQWLAQRFGTQALAAVSAEAVIAGGFIAIGAFIIVGSVISIMDAQDLKVIPDETAKRIGAAADGFDKKMKAEAPAGGEGSGAGAQGAEAALKAKKDEAPRNVLIEKAKENDYFWKGVEVMRPIIVEQALQHWKDNHWWDMKVGGGFGYRRLKGALGALIIRRP